MKTNSCRIWSNLYVVSCRGCWLNREKTDEESAGRSTKVMWDSDGTEPAAYSDTNPKYKVKQVQILIILQQTSDVVTTLTS